MEKQANCGKRVECNQIRVQFSASRVIAPLRSTDCLEHFPELPPYAAFSPSMQASNFFFSSQRRVSNGLRFPSSPLSDTNLQVDFASKGCRGFFFHVTEQSCLDGLDKPPQIFTFPLTNEQVKSGNLMTLRDIRDKQSLVIE